MLKAGLVYIAKTGFWPFSEFCFIFEFIFISLYFIEVQTEPSARFNRNNMEDGATSNGTYLLKMFK